MFRRKSESSSPAAPSAESQQHVKTGCKGRPTPSRKEAEAAARARAKAPRTRKEMAAAARAQRMSQSAKMREAMRTGDDRYLPLRDRGPVKRFVRDYVDSRLTIAELLLPLLVIVMLLGWSGNATLVNAANAFMLLMLLAVAANLLVLRFTMRRELKRRFGPDALSGTTTYAVFRAMNLRFLRMPKPQVKLGQHLPEHYR